MYFVVSFVHCKILSSALLKSSDKKNMERVIEISPLIVIIFLMYHESSPIEYCCCLFIVLGPRTV